MLEKLSGDALIPWIRTTGSLFGDESDAIRVSSIDPSAWLDWAGKLPVSKITAIKIEMIFADLSVDTSTSSLSCFVRHTRFLKLFWRANRKKGYDGLLAHKQAAAVALHGEVLEDSNFPHLQGCDCRYCQKRRVNKEILTERACH